MGLGICYGGWVYTYLIVERYPVRLLSLVLAMHIPISHELMLQHFRAIFFSDFFFQDVQYAVPEFNAAASWFPCAVFVAALVSPLAQEIVPFSVMARKHYRDSDAIYPLPALMFHRLDR